MKLKSIVLAFLVLFLLQGCVGDIIIDDMFGWIPGYQGHGSSSDTKTDKPSFIATVVNVIKDKLDNNNELSQNELDNLEWKCEEHIANSFMNDEGTCVCKPSYGDLYGQCVKLQSTTCNSDLDCGNGVRSKCLGTEKKISYRCDLVNKKCFPPETVSCKTDYSPNFVCANGDCVQAGLI